MTKEQQRIAIAEWMGFVWYRAPQDRHFSDKKYRFLALPAIHEYEGQVDIWKQRADGTEKIIDSEPWKKAQGVDYVPDYPNDLNAMHEAVFNMPLREKIEFSEKLREVVSRFYVGWEHFSTEKKNFYTENATASQRSEALCRTLWPERWEK